MTSYAYIKLSTEEYPRFQGDIRLEHPEIGDVFICPDTYAEVYDPATAVVPGENEIAVEGAPLKTGGRWVRQFTLQPAPPKGPSVNPPSPQKDSPVSLPRLPSGKESIFPTAATGRIEINCFGPTVKELCYGTT
jgi:hypothetical protein